MLDQLEQLKQEAVKEIAAVESLETLNDLRVKYLGKKGPMTEIMKQMGKLSAEERPKVGAVANEVREQLTSAIQEKQEELGAAEIKKQLANETIDVTLPGTTVKEGTAHLLTQVIEEIEDLFIGMGYTIAEGPEVEKDYYNFEALNLPKDHPARDMQDSFYITENTLLRTQTSPVQARVMEQHDFANGPIKIICPGKVYRRDNDDATHSHQFTQIEGLVVDENITLADLKGTLTVLAKKMFGEERDVRLRPSFFPFTEPSVEMDISCFKCGGEGCRVCKGTGWIEILGSGMVHPNVLEMSGIDSKKYSGFAFGMGPERVAMLKYAVDDIRHLYTNDLRFTKQFSVKE
ncbi:phenylalanine--tRNA ligase subunit alpha [Listeria newyorkensis]|uniref:Phenylalanine--tRNA ligase alpha subunit n=1 Tax=Listeria newyorkensis TaxID=1497681 RepID=A0ABX4XJW4_9LIST|nr:MULTISPECIES: phenylalanine--tRNA ligase subunit alpha [Listeria]KGL45001.1 phenylalanine--tRNA ligase [Listeriaceae bacterium FSL A5-0209]KGL40873.1 phenylalanine--tRNA ligase [Listeria newyorkensis]KMT62629.1 phenylalanyl-tRNA ligase subunit alpha [Listeria newyorkensis]PNP87086.1 phenylalanine--tRNA ligase subunit alpha [Listeria newyorkensis]RQW68296.1 phenylalanine--tRNA ligase subunit alpha [Listeria sp. SHR_NRA_18]